MTVRSCLFACLVALVAPLASASEPVTLKLDPGASHAKFTLGSTLHTVHGEMPILEGALRFDPNGGDATGDVVLDARGAVTGNTKRDKKMHQRVLQSATFPELVFHLTRIEGALPSRGSAELRLVGTLELLGSGHEVVIPATVSRTGSTVEGRAAVSVPYVEWGLEDPSVFVLRADKEVQVELDIRGELDR